LNHSNQNEQTCYISTTFIPDGKPVLSALNLLIRNKINAVEIGSNHCYEESIEYVNDLNLDFLVHNYFPVPKNSFVINIASHDEAIRLRSIIHIKDAIDFCYRIGAKLYTFHPGFLVDPSSSNILSDNYDFLWDKKSLKNSDFNSAKYRMFTALDEIIKYAFTKSVRLAVETEGSLSKKDYLLMQYPREFQEFADKYSPNDIGINLNIGHLNLAANAFGFIREDLVDLIQDYIVALE